MMKESKLINSNYESWLESDELLKVKERIGELLEKLDIEVVKLFNIGEYGKYILIGGEDMYILRGGVEEDIEGLVVNIEDIEVSEVGVDVDREEIVELLYLIDDVEVEEI